VGIDKRQEWAGSGSSAWNNTDGEVIDLATDLGRDIHGAGTSDGAPLNLPEA
jgi:hypothetical protein